MTYQMNPETPAGVRFADAALKLNVLVNQGAIDIVSLAMDLMGGAGFTNTQPLARLYRDVRAAVH